MRKKSEQREEQKHRFLCLSFLLSINQFKTLTHSGLEIDWGDKNVFLLAWQDYIFIALASQHEKNINSAGVELVMYYGYWLTNYVYPI